MTQAPHDQLAKQYLQEFLTPLGWVERQYEVPGEAKFVDVWFVPTAPSAAAQDVIRSDVIRPDSIRPDSIRSDSIRSDAIRSELGLLGRMTQVKCLLEPYRNAPSRSEVRTSLLKLLWIQSDEQRKADSLIPESELPRLWVLAATASKPLLQDAQGVIRADWMPGVYFMADLLKSGIVVIDELPETPDTLWIRVLGRDATQARAIREVLALPESEPKRLTVLRLLASWKVTMNLDELTDFVEREESIMAFSEAFLAWEQATEDRGREEGHKAGLQAGQQAEKAAIALTLIQRQMPLAAIAEITGLSLEEIQSLQSS
jgi:hypothetical protein